MLYLITGINGVGKSEFINELIDTTENFYSIQGSAELMKALKLKIGDYEGLRNYDEKITKDVFKRIILKANRKYGSNQSNHAVMDAHILNIKNGKITRVMDSDTIKLFSTVIHLYAKTSEIIKRIKLDRQTRDRSIFGEETKKRKDKVYVLDSYAKQFKETIKKECSIANVLLKEIPHFNNKTHVALQIFSEFHERMLRKERPIGF